MNREQRRKAMKKQSVSPLGNLVPDPATDPATDRGDPLEAALSLHKSGQLQQAQVLYEKILKSQPRNSKLLNYLGVLKTQIGDRAGAIDLLEKAVSLEPQNFGYLNNLGNVYRAADRLTDAIDCYQKALLINPQSSDSHLNLGIALTERGEVAAAIQAFETALAANPYHPRAHITLGDLLQSQGELDRAIASYQKAIALQPNNFDALTSLGMAFYRKGYLQESQRTYEHALAIEPFSTSALANIAATFYEQGRMDMAVACYREAINIEPQNADARINLGFLMGQQGNYTEAEAYYRKAIELAPNAPKAIMGLAELLGSQEQWRSAIPLYEQIVADDEDRSDLQLEARAQFGIALRAMGDLTGAIAQFEQVLHTNPQHIKANAHLGLTLQLQENCTTQFSPQTIFNYEQSVKRYQLEIPQGFKDLQEFNAQLRDYIYQHPTLLADRAGKPINKGKQTYEIFTDSTAVMQALSQSINVCLQDYFSQCAATNHPFFQAIPTKWNLSGWAVVLSPQGFQTAHIHPESFCSGVYYIQVPDSISHSDTHEGYLSFSNLFPNEPENQRLQKYTIAPQEGLLVLFPSYFWHSTIPFSGDSLQDALRRDRICISFNVIPND
ncbi:tetratricopeptide repeat protein [Pseudanabaena sp. PCC 6802]|uniref:tetratricopeptide repeat protein n=1 Tax=Pseudanabaena sp. PCC 6802 TaxID=118173 RepID=UPI00034BC36D|nr:tetratricopeptide repeat protein [Pseudanabaena sp. PCC 6802]